MKKIALFLSMFFITLCVFSGSAVPGKNFSASYIKVNSIDDPKPNASNSEQSNCTETEQKKSFIKWIDFNVSAEILGKAYDADLQLKKQGEHSIGTCEILAFLALKNGNNFNIRRDTTNLNKLMKELKSGDKTSLEKYAENKYYKYYLESYHAILDGIIGEGEKGYGIKGYHPIAKGFWVSEYDDFGNSRGYGFKRRHLGHDMFGGVGAPITAVEGGTVTELGWNQYGGWRVGIRSEDSKRYYYYAHLRKNKPFPANLKLGDKVVAGQVIGFLGVTGYSRKPNTNMATTKPHLHFGMQIIFDKSQEDGNGEIWIDVYQICKFLRKHKSPVIKNSKTGEYESTVTPGIIREVASAWLSKN